MEESEARTSMHANQTEEVRLDWTHCKEAINHHHTPGPDLISTGQENVLETPGGETQESEL
jgi:hypothetical protein